MAEGPGHLPLRLRRAPQRERVAPVARAAHGADRASRHGVRHHYSHGCGGMAFLAHEQCGSKETSQQNEHDSGSPKDRAPSAVGARCRSQGRRAGLRRPQNAPQHVGFLSAGPDDEPSNVGMPHLRTLPDDLPVRVHYLQAARPRSIVVGARCGSSRGSHGNGPPSGSSRNAGIAHRGQRATNPCFRSTD